MKYAVSLLLAVLCALPLAATDIRVFPGAEIYTWDVDARRGIRSALIQNLAVVQPDGAPVQIERLTIALTDRGRVREQLTFDQQDLDKSAAKLAALQKSGALALYEFAFQPKKYLGDKTQFAESSKLTAGTALVLVGTPLLLPRGVDVAHVTASGTTSEGAAIEASLDVKLVEYVQANDYRWPLRGTSTAVVGPSFSEPHRWAQNEEFAFDVIRTGASGKTCKDDCSKLSDYYIFGTDVVAMADGVVVAVENGQPESSTRLRQPGESADAFMQRTMEEQMKLLQKGTAGVAGNYVVLQHAGGEYSVYAHLAANSARVKVGDRVKQGYVIAKVGSSGNSTEPHLHFGLMNGPDPLYSRSLPVRFSGITTVDGPQEHAAVQTGWIIEAK